MALKAKASQAHPYGSNPAGRSSTRVRVTPAEQQEPMAVWRTAHQETRAAAERMAMPPVTPRMRAAGAAPTADPEASAATHGSAISAMEAKAVARFPRRLIASRWAAEAGLDRATILTD